MAVTIDGRTLKGRQVLRVARPGASGRYEKATLAKSAREAIAATRAHIDANFMNDEAPFMYSFNTGVGLFKDQRDLRAGIVRGEGIGAQQHGGACHILR
ncbi:MAG: hypothetical protein EOP19_27410, partial [Hyphomicrobiales bacterium]